ncbi:hypothetical protein CRE_18675 [Caenorhabditis remanei]|uniref:Serpentine Receptor, class H n=1 Tax=Caenorhabditis remanei TaxID=31234 RepID=E3LL11_CAERE|nr:hypothetical protein CRE_18675 [Caenorhabditis remanei]
MATQQEIDILLAEPTNFTYDQYSLIGSSCQHIHIPRITENEFLLYLHLITFISTIFTLFAVYCIIFHSSHSMGQFKWCLLNLQSWTYITDFTLSSLTAPRFFFPIIGGRPLGILINLGMSVPLQIYFGFGCFGVMVASVTFLFLYRHQVTVNPDSLFNFNRPFQIAVMVLNYLIYINTTLPALFTSPESQVATKIDIMRTERCPPKDILHADSFVLQKSITLLFPYFCFLVIFVGAQCGLMALHCSWILFFSTLTRKLSKRTRRMQVKFLFALLAQIAIPTTLCYCPIFYYAITTLIDHYWQFANDLCVLIISTHGLISATCVLLFYDCYRHHLISLLCFRSFRKSALTTGITSRNSIIMTNFNVTVMT